MQERLAAAVLPMLVAACSYAPLQPLPRDAAGDTAADIVVDASADAPPDAQACFDTSLLTNVNICLEVAPAAPRTISASTALNTDEPNMCARVSSGGDGYCVVAATAISVEATLRATGTRSLVLIARDSITITQSGTIHVASSRSSNPPIGAGGDSATCATGTLPTSAGGTNGGGAGGSFAGSGGRGGNAGGSPGGAGGVPAAIVAPIPELRGGCPGQDGQGAGLARGARGHGGGAVLLLAGNSITVTGNLNASGGGGGGGVNGNAGGGGGGSGGMIVFDAPTVTSTGLILANGGGGGEGSDAAASGNSGADPTSTAAVLGGRLGSTNGTNGGDGSAGAMTAGANGVNSSNASAVGGGGGGGGGAGLIRAPQGHSLGPNVSPAVAVP